MISIKKGKDGHSSTTGQGVKNGNAWRLCFQVRAIFETGANLSLVQSKRLSGCEKASSLEKKTKLTCSSFLVLK